MDIKSTTKRGKINYTAPQLKSINIIVENCNYYKIFGCDFINSFMCIDCKGEGWLHLVEEIKIK